MCKPGSSAPRRVARHSRDRQNPSTNAASTKRRRSSSRRETSLETAKAIGLWPLRAPSRSPRTATQLRPHTTSRATWDSGISLRRASASKNSMTSMIEGAHQSGVYDPAGVAEFMRDFQYAGAISPVSMPTFVRTLGYANAQLRALGISDSETAILATAAMQRGGITNTKAGTWLRDYYQKLLPDGKKEHDAALQEMGLIDDKGNVTWHATKADGSEDYRQELLNQSMILNTFEDKEKALGDPGKERMITDMHQAFGQQGEASRPCLAIPPSAIRSAN